MSIRFEVLDVVGNGYILDHIREADLQRAEEMSYRAYVTDTLQAISMHMMIDKRWAEVAPTRTRKAKQPVRTFEQTVAKFRKDLCGEEENT